MKKGTKKDKGFSFIEILVVVAIIAILAAIAVPAYNKIQERAERSVAIDNAQAMVSCINAHNKTADTDDTISPITGVFSGEYVVLTGVDSSGNIVPEINSLTQFNDICENKISLLSEEDYVIAMEYITILYPDDEFAVKEGYDHTT